MNVLIIDDEPPARSEMRVLLSSHPEIKIIGEAATVDEACDAITRLQPDAIFLDINLRGGVGFDVLDRLPPPHPHVVFCTAYDEHAMHAFEVNALAYLVKPVHPERLAAAVTRLLQLTPSRPTESLRIESRVFVREGERCWFVPVDDIEMIHAEGNYSRIHFAGGSPLLYRSVTSLEERLPAPPFLRVNRSQIIHTGHIVALQPWFSQSLKATMRSGAEVEFSRRAALLFREQSSL